jgi:hypothetical protein
MPFSYEPLAATGFKAVARVLSLHIIWAMRVEYRALFRKGRDGFKAPVSV